MSNLCNLTKTYLYPLMKEKQPQKQLILASQSPFRAELLSRLKLDFKQIAADIDESERTNESPEELVQRLALLKAKAVLDLEKAKYTSTNFVVIGSDQVACHSGKILGKPHTREKAIEQLSSFSESKVNFYTSVCILSNNKKKEYLDITSVHFKNLSISEIENYLDSEDVLNCAGSFKSEGLGICLFEKIINNDPTALIGLPMIWLASALLEFDVKIL